MSREHSAKDLAPRSWSTLDRVAYWTRRPTLLLRRARERALSKLGKSPAIDPGVENSHRALSAPPSLPLVHLGTDYGGWWVPDQWLGPDDVVVSAGAGEDISFDVEVAKRYRCRLIILDPTPRAVVHFQGTKDAINASRPAPINNSRTDFYDAEAADIARINFRPWGLWKENTTLHFHPPADASGVSHSAVNLADTGGGFEAECVTLKELLRREGLTGMSMLKMDIEGAEFDVLEDLVASDLRPKFVLAEFHPGQCETERTKRTRTLATLRGLYDQGYRLVRRERWDYVLEYRPG